MLGSNLDHQQTRCIGAIDMIKADFNRAKKYLKNKLPYKRFKLDENGKPYCTNYHCSEVYISISVETLFDIVNELSKKKKT